MLEWERWGIGLGLGLEVLPPSPCDMGPASRLTLRMAQRATVGKKCAGIMRRLWVYYETRNQIQMYLKPVHNPSLQIALCTFGSPGLSPGCHNRNIYNDLLWDRLFYYETPAVYYETTLDNFRYSEICWFTLRNTLDFFVYYETCRKSLWDDYETSSGP